MISLNYLKHLYLARQQVARTLSFLLLAALNVGLARAQPKNVLFIYVDDLRPEIGAYGATHVQTPNMDTLAAQGLRFNRAYVQQAVCHPSRVSTLTGVRPDTAGVTDLVTDFRDRLPDIQTLPQLFKDNGYHSVGFGKIYHSPSVNDDASWSEPTTGFSENYQDPIRAVNGASNKPPFEEPTNSPPESAYADTQIADAAIARLETLATDYSGSNKPFFMAVGFLKPHLPFVAPKAYWDLYDVNTVPIPTGADAFPPTNALSSYLRDGFSGELSAYPTGQPSVGTNPATDIIEFRGDTKIYPDFYARQLTEGYLACVSFIDAQIGKLMAALDDPNGDGNTADSLVNDTIIVLIGDHGFHLGQHGNWPKHTNFEIANRTPLIVVSPGMTTAGESTDSIVEFIDMYPTLVELTGLEAPDHLEGVSFVPILEDNTVITKPHAISQYPRSSGNADYMSYSIRTDRYRYTEWRRIDNGLVAFRELYDHLNDPSENHNIAVNSANETILATLETTLAEEVGLSAGNMPASTEVYEGFFYQAGKLESNDIGGKGFNTGWFGWRSLRNSNSGSQVVSDSWNTPTGYGWVPFGNVGANGTASGNEPTRSFQEANHIDLAQNDTRYFSFLYRPENSAETFRLWFYDDDGSTLALQLESRNLNLLLGFTNSSFKGTPFAAGNDYLIVGKITSVASGNDTIEVNVYSSGDTVPATEPNFTYSASAASSHNIDRVVFGVPFTTAGASIRFDEFRMDSTYEAVIGVGPSSTVPPIAYNATITGTEQTGQTLPSSYIWFDANAGDIESNTLFQWQRSANNGVTWSDISSATAVSERPGPLEADGIMRVLVTPGSNNAPTHGNPAPSEATGIIADGSVSDGLTAYWPFEDEGDPTRDVSPNDHDAGINSSNAAFVAGKYGLGLQLSGSDTAQAGDIPLAGNQLSISAWVKHDGAYNSGTWEMIIGKNWAGGLAFGVNASTDQFRFQVKLSDGSDFYAQFNVASTAIPADTWTHVCGVRDGNSITIYINGAMQLASFTTGASILDIINTTDQVYLGSHNFAGGNYWRGVIDEVRIYERPLSATEVSALAVYNPLDTGDPVADWKNETFAHLPQGADDPQAADHADPESDSIPNLAEYAFGTNPGIVETPPLEIQTGTFHFVRRIGAGSGSTVSGYSVDGVTYTPGVTSELVSGVWRNGPSVLEETAAPTNNGDGTETVILRALTPETTPSGPLDNAVQFFRVDLTR